MDEELRKRRTFFKKEMYKGSFLLGLLYFLVVYIIFDLKVSLYLTVFNSVVGIFFIKPIIDAAFDKNIGKIQLYSIVNTLIIIISSSIVLFYYSFPILDIILFDLIVILIISAVFHSNVAHTINLTKGYLDISSFENNPVTYIGATLAVWQFMQVPLFTGLIWLVINDVSHSLLISLLLYSITLLFNQKRARLIVNDQKKTHSILLFMVDTIVIITATLLIYYFNKDALMDNKYYILIVSFIYYLMKADSKEFFMEETPDDE